MREERLGSYSIVATLAGILSLVRLKSIIRYLPPKCTAGLATLAVRASRRVPRPPAKIIATISLPIFKYLLV